MALKEPYFDLIFQQLSSELIERGENGNAFLIIRDDTDKSFNIKKYNSMAQIEEDEELYTEDNFAYIKDAMTFKPYVLYVLRIDTITASLSSALALAERTEKVGRVTIADGTQSDYNALATWGKEKEANKEGFTALTYKPSTAPDCMQVEDFGDMEWVRFNDTTRGENGKVSGNKYLPSMLGILTSCGIKRSPTNFTCSNLSECSIVSDRSESINSGKLILKNAYGEVKVVLGINSMTTTNGKTRTEDMKYIDTVEKMKRIYSDLKEAFAVYQNGYNNTPFNQSQYISAANDYLTNLSSGDTEILNPNYANRIEINVDAQRKAWVQSTSDEAKKQEREKWTDAYVIDMPFKRTMFVVGHIFIFGSMDNMEMILNME